MKNFYDNCIKTIQWFFGVLVALSLTHLFRDQRENFDDDIWLAFLLCASLFCRYLIGSANHMGRVYVEGKPEFQFKLFKDFAFLAIFGFLAVRITDSENPEELLLWIGILLSVGLLWTMVDCVVDWRSTKPSAKKKFPELGVWAFWFWINLVQAGFTWSLYVGWERVADFRTPDFPWSIPLSLLLIVYVVLMVWDLHLQFAALQSYATDMSKSEDGGASKAPPTPIVSPETIAGALKIILQSKPEDFNGQPDIERLPSDARLAWQEATVRFVQASKEVRPPAPMVSKAGDA